MSWVEWIWAIVTAPLIVLAMLAVYLHQRGVSPRLLLCAAGLHRWKPTYAPPWRMSDGCRAYPILGHRCRRCGARRSS